MNMKLFAFPLLLCTSLAIAAPQTVTTTADQTITGVKTFSGSNKLCLKDPGDADVGCLVSPAITGSKVWTMPSSTGTLVTTSDLSGLGLGDVIGPASATDGAFALFDGATGKQLKNSSAPGTGVMTFLATPSSANLRSALTDETGTGGAVFADTPTLITPVLGVATATSINKVAITAPVTSATLTIANGKTATVNNSITFAGTDSTTMTFPSATATIARTDAGQTFTGTQVFSSAPTFSSTTAGRVLLAGSSGALTDSSNLSLITTGAANSRVQLQLSVNGDVSYVAQNLSTGTAGYGGLFAINSANYVGLLKLSTGYTTSGLVVAGTNWFTSDSGSYLFTTATSSDSFVVATAGQASTNEGLRVDGSQNVSIGNAALATNAANGFLYLTSMAGAPSGTPTSKTGRVPCVIDTSNVKLMCYIGGAWKGITLS